MHRNTLDDTGVVYENIYLSYLSVYLLNEARPWVTGDSTSPRRAAVLVNDGGGRRAALILEEEPEKEDRA